MRRGNFFRRNQYKIAAVCLLAAVLGLTGMYMLRGRQTAKEEPQAVADDSEKNKGEQVAKTEKKETEKETKKAEAATEKKAEEKDAEQTARVSAIVRPKSESEKKNDEMRSIRQNSQDAVPKPAAQPREDKQPQQEPQAGQTETAGEPVAESAEQEGKEKKKKTAETAKTNQAADVELHFNAKNGLLWPLEGPVILDYSMDKTIYFTTLDQYKYNPAVIISGNVNDKVKAAASGKITDISVNEVTGKTVTMDLGDGYTAIYGQLKEVPYEAGAYLKAGETVGFVSEPTKYYSLEGSNLYFALEKDSVPADPVELFATQTEE